MLLSASWCPAADRALLKAWGEMVPAERAGDAVMFVAHRIVYRIVGVVRFIIVIIAAGPAALVLLGIVPFIIVIVASGPAALVFIRDDQAHIAEDIRPIDVVCAGIIDVIDYRGASVVELSLHVAVPAVDKHLGTAVWVWARGQVC